MWCSTEVPYGRTRVGQQSGGDVRRLRTSRHLGGGLDVNLRTINFMGIYPFFGRLDTEAAKEGVLQAKVKVVEDSRTSGMCDQSPTYSTNG